MAKSIAAYNEQIASLTKEHDTLWRQIRPLQKRAESLAGQIGTLTEKRDTLELAAREDPDAIDIKLVLTGDTKSTALYREQNRMLAKLGLAGSGYYPATGQRSIHIQLIKGDPERTRLTLESLNLLLPHVLPVEGRRRFGIYERSLSEHGVWEIGILADGSIEIGKTTYGRYAKHHGFADLSSALEYCEQHLYRERADGEYEDDDEDAA